MNHPKSDPGIPVLTEIIPPPAAGTAAADSPPPAPPIPPAAQEAVTDIPASAHAAGAIDEETLRYLERDVSDRVLQQLLERIDFVLEQRVRDSLADVLQTAVASLATEIRQGLQQTLEDVIAHAISRELARLRSTKK